MTKIFLTDADNVLLSWKEHFLEFAHKHTKGQLDITKYDLGLGQEKMDKIADKFNTSIEFSRISPFLDAKEYVQKIHEKGYKFVVITNCFVNEWNAMMRERNLIDIFGTVFQDIYCLPYHSSKEHLLKEYAPTFWIDDKMQNCIAGVNAGHKSFILRQEHNLTDHNKDVISVNSWKEIYAYL